MEGINIEIDVFKNSSPHWEKLAEKIEQVNWGAAKYLANRMRKDFKDWESVIVAIDEDKIAGFCSIVKQDIARLSYTPYIATVYVDPAYRGQHLSAKMITKAEAQLQHLNFSEVYILSGLENFYEKLGYKPVGKTKDMFDRKMTTFCKKLTD